MNQKESPLTRYLQGELQQLKDRGLEEKSVHGYVLRHGKLFTSQGLTPEEIGYIDRSGWQKHEPRECYHNAQSTALKMPVQEGMDLMYVEGFVSKGSGYAVYHAWLSLNGKLVDTTLRTEDGECRVMGIIPEGSEYYGVELETLECLHSFQHGGMGPIIDDWQCGWPLLARENN